MEKNTKPRIFPEYVDAATWDEWLANVESKLSELGYRKYKQNLKHEDFAYWKVFNPDGDEGYQVGIFFYDFRKFQNDFNVPQRIGLQYECMFRGDADRIDLVITKDITLDEVEEISNVHYTTMLKYLNL